MTAAPNTDFGGALAPGIRVLRVIARMTGGAAYHVAVLGGRLDAGRYQSVLVHGRLGPGEGSVVWLAEREDCRRVVVEQLSPEMRPLADFGALIRLIKLVRGSRPHIVETHTAKAGVLGRVAAVLAGRPRPVIVHTYHGHVLEGYFGRAKSELYRRAERWLARISDGLVAVSEATVDDLVRLGVAERERFRVIHLGLDLEPLVAADGEATPSVRARLGVPDSGLLLLYVGRLVPIKRLDMLLWALARLRAAEPQLYLAMVGDGESRPELEQLAAQLGLEERVIFTGYVQDVTALTVAADIAVLSSDSEGTPVALIEAAAAARPAVATEVGGVSDVVLDGLTGVLVGRGDDRAMADAIRRLAADSELRRRMGARARRHVLERYPTERLVRDVETLYEELLQTRKSR